MLLGRLGPLFGRAAERRGGHRLSPRRIRGEEVRAVSPCAQNEPAGLVDDRHGDWRTELAGARLSGPRRTLSDLERPVDHRILRAVNGRRAGETAPSSRGASWPGPAGASPPPAGSRPPGPRTAAPCGRPP